MKPVTRALGGFAAALAPFAAVPVVGAEPPPIGVVRNADSPKAVEGSYLVALRDSTDAAAGTTADLAAEYRGEVTHTYGAVFHGFAARMSAEDAARLAADPTVDYVEQNTRAVLSGEPGTAATRDGAAWGLDRIDQRRSNRDGKYHFVDKGAGVRIYVLDTGVRTSHNEFDGPWGSNRASAARDYVGGDGQDCNGHGTHVAATAAGQTYGVAPAAHVVGLRLFDCEGEGGEVADIVAALDHVVRQNVRPAVVNMSFGVPASGAVDGATERVLSAGYAVVAAAGNNGGHSSYISPARVPGVLTVAASNRDDKRPYWSNHGPTIDLHAPGDDILSADHAGDSATKTRNGTSMAAPHVAGAAARFLQTHPTAQAGDVHWALTRNATSGIVTESTSPPPGWSPGNPPGDPGNPEPTENSAPIGIANTPALLLHAAIQGQPDGDCALVRTTLGAQIPDAGAGTMTRLPITGCDSIGMWGPVRVGYRIDHPRPADLRIDLVAPSGARYRLRNSGQTGSVVDVTVWPSVDEPFRNGVWHLDVVDVTPGATGRLNGSEIRF